MEISTKLSAKVIAVASLAVAPSLIAINPAEASSHYCRDQKGKSQNWIKGYQQGWFDHNNGYPYDLD